MLAPTWRLEPSTSKGGSISEVMRSAIEEANSTSAPVSSTANSSPPSRATTSSERVTLRSRGPINRSSSSPVGCPKESLISLKWSRSIIKRARSPSGPSDPVRVASRDSSSEVNRLRLPRPVSSSVTAWWWCVRVRALSSRWESPDRTPTSTRVATVRPRATPLTCVQLPTNMIMTEATTATAGSTRLGAGASSSDRRTPTRNQTVKERKKRAVIQLASSGPPAL